MGYLHNNTATQMCENVLGPVNKLLSCDYEGKIFTTGLSIAL